MANLRGVSLVRSNSAECESAGHGTARANLMAPTCMARKACGLAGWGGRIFSMRCFRIDFRGRHLEAIGDATKIARWFTSSRWGRVCSAAC